jgi:mannitol/fructose-specific phosphotransferase system IIA component (Ntr-type)
VKETGRLQNLLVFGLLGILGAYLFSGLPAMGEERFIPFFTAGPQAFLATVGMVFVSYGGIAAVMDVGGEVKDPAKNVPRGMFLAFGVVNLFYILVALVTVGVLDGGELGGSLRPVAKGAYALWGQTGLLVIGIASLLAYATTGNAGILSASRSPLAMSHDGLLPARFSRIHPRYGTPTVAVLVTSVMMLLVVTLLSVEDLVKTASTMLLISLVLINVSVIVMRQSRIAAYAPAFRMPLCPWLPGAAIVLYLFLIAEMGLVPLLVTSAFLAAASIWYIVYVQPRIDRESAVAYLVKSILSRHIARSGLENELVHISLERDAVEMDRFDRLVKDAPILDLAEPIDGAGLFARISEVMAPRLRQNPADIEAALLARERDSSTVIQPGLAIPHVIVEGRDVFDLALVRCRGGASFSPLQPPVHTAFVLLGSRDQRSYHLRALVAIAHIVQNKDFQARWLAAKNAEQLRDIVLLADRERHSL